MSFLYDMARMTISGTPGTGPITLASAVSGFQSFAAAGIPDGATISISIREGVKWEVGKWTVSASATLITRVNTRFSSNANAAVSFTNSAIVSAAPLAEDFNTRVVLPPNSTIDVYASWDTGSDATADPTNPATPTKHAGVAIDYVFDNFEVDVTVTVNVHMADTATMYDEEIIMPQFIGGGGGHLIGNVTTPGNVKVTNSVPVNGAPFVFLGAWTIAGVRSVPSDDQFCFLAANLNGFMRSFGLIEADVGIVGTGRLAYVIVGNDNFGSSVLGSGCTLTVIGSDVFNTLWTTTNYCTINFTSCTIVFTAAAGGWNTTGRTFGVYAILTYSSVVETSVTYTNAAALSLVSTFQIGTYAAWISSAGWPPATGTLIGSSSDYTCLFKVNFGHPVGMMNPSYNYQIVTTGFSFAIADRDWHIIFDPAGTLATGTVTMPPNPPDGKIVNIRSSKTVTAMTFSPNSGQFVAGAPSTLAAGKMVEAIYRQANSTWYFG